MPANIFLTPRIVGLEALRILRPQMGMMHQVNVDYSAEFVNVGDTISVRRPTTFSVSDMLNADGSYNTTYVQAIKEGAVPVRINKWKDVSFALNAKDKTLVLPMFTDRVIAPAVTKLVAAIESDLLALYKDVPTYYGTPGTTPQSLQDYAGIKNTLFQQLVPFGDRKVSLFLDGTATMQLQPLLTVLSGGGRNQDGNDDLSNDQLAVDLYGMKPFSSQLIMPTTPGSIGTGATPTASGSAQPDLTTTQYISIASGAATGVLNHGDILSIAGCQGTYVVLGTNAGGSEVYTAAGGAIAAVPIYPNLVSSVTGTPFQADGVTAFSISGADVTVLAAHTPNLAFHRDAFTLAIRNLAMPESIKAEIVTDEDTGLSLRVSFGWDVNYQQDVCNIGLLYGAATLDQRLAARFLG